MYTKARNNFKEKLMAMEPRRGTNHEFPCPTDGRLVTFNDCSNCPKSNRCDIYASMLDEDFD